jgi:phospholipase/carboxylesterase
MTTLPAVILEPADRPDAAVLWLHGLGASGHDFVPIAPHLGLPRARFVFPHAPERPVTINGGARMPAWYDITTLAPGPGREPEGPIREGERLVTAWLDRLAADGIPPERTILAGFSQGGALALHVGHRHPRPLAGLLVLSAYALLDATIDAEGHPANAATPIHFFHGDRDDVVPLARGRGAYERYAREDREVRWAQYPMGHEVCLDEVRAIGGWLRGVLAG